MTGTTSGVLFSQNEDDVHMQVFKGKSINFEVIWGGTTPIDVTGYGAFLHIRDLKGVLMLEMSTANGKITLGGSDGRLSFSGTDTDSRAVDRAGVWELELITQTGQIYRALSGTVAPVEEIVL